MADHYTKMCLVQLLEKHMDSNLRQEVLNWLLRTEFLILEVILEFHCNQCGLPQKVLMFVTCD